MIGWHYTTLNNWLKIQKRGLKCQRQDEDFFTDSHWTVSYLKKLYGKFENFKGIWVWRRKPNWRNENLNVLYQLVKERRFPIVLLKVQYEKGHTLEYKGKPAILNHHWFLDDKQVHRTGTAHILIKDIPKEKVSIWKPCQAFCPNCQTELEEKRIYCKFCDLIWKIK